MEAKLRLSNFLIIYCLVNNLKFKFMNKNLSVEIQKVIIHNIKVPKCKKSF